MEVWLWMLQVVCGWRMHAVDMKLYSLTHSLILILVGTHFRIVRRDKTGVTILLHMPHATVASSSSTSFGVYRIDVEQQVVRAIVPHALKEFRHELEINGSGVALAETLVDFVAVPQKNARSNFALWSLWRRSDGAGDTVRMADLVLPQRPNIALDIARWTTVLRSAYAPRLVTFDDVVRFVSRCQSVTLLRHSYELYVGSPVLVGNIAEISKAELRDYILQAIQQQATVSNHRRRGNVVDEDMNVAPNADALQLEATRFTRIAERLCVDESTAFALAAAGDGKSVLSVKPSGLGFFPVADFIDLSVAHLVGSLDVALVASDAAMRDEASVVNVLDCIAAATSGWSTDVWQPIAEDLSSRLSEPISASVITHAREMRERYFTSSTTVASLRSLSIADLELMAVVLVGEQTESRGDEAPATMSACTLFADVSTFASRRLQYALALLLAVACRATAASTQEELQRLTTLYVGAIRHVRLYRAVCTAVNIGSTSAFITAINDVLPSSNCTTARTTLHALVSVDDASLAAILAWHLTLATRYEDAFNLLTLYERRSWVLCAWGHYWLAVGDWGKAADQFELFAAEVGMVMGVISLILLLACF